MTSISCIKDPSHLRSTSVQVVTKFKKASSPKSAARPKRSISQALPILETMRW